MNAIEVKELYTLAPSRISAEQENKLRNLHIRLLEGPVENEGLIFMVEDLLTEIGLSKAEEAAYGEDTYEYKEPSHIHYSSIVTEELPF